MLFSSVRVPAPTSDALPERLECIWKSNYRILGFRLEIRGVGGAPYSTATARPSLRQSLTPRQVSPWRQTPCRSAMSSCLSLTG